MEPVRPESDPALDTLRLAYDQASHYLIRASSRRIGSGARLAARLSLLEALGELEGLTSGRVCSGASTGPETMILLSLGAQFRALAQQVKFELAESYFGTGGTT